LLVPGARHDGVALPELRRLKLDEPLLVEVLERGHDPAPLLAERRGRVVGSQRRPGSPGPPRRDEAAEEARAGVVEARDDVFERSLSERPEPIAGVEGSALPEQPVELEIGESRP